MPGRRPIFVSLVTKIITFLRDHLFKATLEPESPAKRRARRIKKASKSKKEK